MKRSMGSFPINRVIKFTSDLVFLKISSNFFLCKLSFPASPPTKLKPLRSISIEFLLHFFSHSNPIYLLMRLQLCSNSKDFEKIWNCFRVRKINFQLRTTRNVVLLKLFPDHFPTITVQLGNCAILSRCRQKLHNSSLISTIIAHTFRSKTKFPFNFSVSFTSLSTSPTQ